MPSKKSTSVACSNYFSLSDNCQKVHSNYVGDMSRLVETVKS